VSFFRCVLVVVLLAALYILFAGTLSVSEGSACVVAVAGAGFYLMLARRAKVPRFAFRAVWILVLPRLGWGLARDTMLVGRALVISIFRVVRGELLSQRFTHGGESGAAGARRALVTLGVSLAPNGYVVRVPVRGNFLLVHQLVPAPMKTDEEWPV